MGATKSGRNILRLLGLALVFVLALTLAISGFLLTRAGANASISSAEHTTEPDTKFLEIGDDWTWQAPLTADSTNFVSKTYSPSTYTTFYLYISGAYAGISGQTLNDTVAKHSPGVTSGTRLTMYAYYKLPSFLIDIGATLDFSLDWSNCFSTNKIESLETSITLCGGPGNDSNAIASPAKVTEGLSYIKVFATGNDSAAFSSEYMQFKDMHITMTVTSATNIASIITKPVIAAWNGTDSSSTAPVSGTLSELNNLYLNDRYIVGGNATDGWYFDASDGDTNELKNIYLTSLRTDGVAKKAYSFTIYDFMSGLKTATINGFDLMTRSEDNTPVTKDGYTFNRANTTSLAEGAIAFPEGLESVTVKPFGYKDESDLASTYRGMQVTVVYDGLDKTGEDMIYPKAYRVVANNLFDINTDTLAVTIGGFDYTPPTLPVLYITSDYTIGTDGVTKWIDTSIFTFRAELDKDAREDVIYRYWLKKVDASGSVLETIIDGEEFIPNENYLGDDLTFTDLDNGHYILYVSAIDEVGRINKTNGMADSDNIHLVKMTEEQGIRFSVDSSTSGYQNSDWGINATVGTDEYLGNWTKDEVIVHFNNLFIETKELCSVTYYVRYDGVTAALSTDWTVVPESKIVDGYLISADTGDEKYGFARTYYFKAVLESGKVFEYSTFVKFDDWEEYEPYTTSLDNYVDIGTPYADLLTLATGVYLKKANGDYIGINDNSIKGGSERTLFYTVDGGTAKIATVANGETQLDLFGGKNIDATKQVEVKLWVEDEAGNKSNEFTKNIYLTSAKIYIRFIVNNNVNKFYSNSTETPLGLLSYKLYKTSNLTEANLISSNELEASFTSAYEDKNAGLNKNVIAKNVMLKKPAATSKYYGLYNEYYVVAVNTAGDMENAVQIDDENTSIVAAQHTIQKARIAINQETGLSWTYNGETLFEIINPMDSNTFRCVDTVVGEEWRGIVWTGTLSFNGISNVFYDINTGDVVKKSAQILKNSVLLKWADGADASANYQVANYLGSTSTQLSCYATLTPAYITLTTFTTLDKIYDGKINVNITANDYKLNGVVESDASQVYLDLAKLNEAQYNSANVGKNYSITVDTVLAGNRKNNYVLVNNLTDRIPLTQAVFSNVSISPKPISVTFGTAIKTFDNTTALVITKGTSATENKYAFTGLVSASDDVTLNYTGGYPDFNAGSYNDITINISLAGDDAGNYTLGDVKTATLSGEIRKYPIRGAKLIGVYVVDENNEYLYKDAEGNVYQKINESEYTKYNATGEATVVTRETMLASAGCAIWADTKFVKGGTIIVNNHRFDLGDKVNFAVICYTDMAMTTPVNLTNLDYLAAKNVPIIINENSFNFNAVSGEYAISIGNFDKSANFIFVTGTLSNTVGINLFITDFDDVIFDGKTYLSETDASGINGYNVIFDGNVKHLDIVYDEELSEDPVEYSISFGKDAYGNDIIPMRAGTYTATLRFERNHGIYIAYQTLVIEKKDIELSLISTADISKAYGENYMTEVQKLSVANDTVLKAYEKLGGNGVVLNEIRSNVYYQYSTTANFKTVLDKTPYLTGSGEYYVRAAFNGNKDFNGAVSEPRKIVIDRVMFHAYDVSGIEGETINEITIDDIIDEGANDDVRNCFVIVYEQEVPINGSEVGSASRFLTKVPTSVGTYRYTVVHKDRIDYEEFESDGYGVINNEYDTYLAMTTAGIYNAKLIIGLTSVNSMGTNGLTNGNGTLNATTTTPILPAIRPDLGELMFYAIDQTGTNWKSNFNNGLNEQVESLGYYTIATLYQTSLKIKFADTTEQNVTDFNTVAITLKANANNDSKLFRFDINGDGTYSVKEVSYVKNSDGTISFETDKLGWFALADSYTPATPKDVSLTIGLSVGGAIIAILAVAIVLVIVKKKKIA